MTKSFKEVNQSYSQQIKNLNDKFVKLINFYQKNEENYLQELHKDTFQFISILTNKASKYKSKAKSIKQKTQIKTLELEASRVKMLEPQTLNTLASSDRGKYKEKEIKSLDLAAMNIIKQELIKSKESIKNLRNIILKSISSKKKLKIQSQANFFSNKDFRSISTKHQKKNYFKEIIEEDSLFLSDKNTVGRNLICLAKNLANELNETFRCYERNSPIALSMSQAIENFRKTILNAVSCENFTDPTDKLKEELENCKKTGKMYEEKLKLKIETISLLRDKLKEISYRENQIKNNFIQYDTWQKINFFKIIDKVNAKTDEVNKRLEKIKDFFINKLKNILEELKSINRDLDREEIYNIHADMLETNIRNLEDINSEQFEKIIALQVKNSSIKNKKRKWKADTEILKNECEELNNQIKECLDIREKYEDLEQTLKIKTFQLKHAEFERNQVFDDRDELLSKVNELEIEIIELREYCNEMNISYNKKIEEIIISDTLNKNLFSDLQNKTNWIIKKNNEAINEKIELKNTEIKKLHEVSENSLDISTNS